MSNSRACTQRAEAAHRLVIGLALIGSGMIGPVHRAAALGSGRFALVAATPSSRPEAAAETGAAWGLPPHAVFHDWRAMLDLAPGLGIQAVAIATPNHLHAEQIAAARAAGLFVVCDKPVTATLAQAQALAATPGPPIAVTYNYSAFETIRRARAMVAANEIGDLLQVAVEFAQDGRLAAQKPRGWRHDPARSGPAGSLADIGTHAFHLLEFTSQRRVESLAALAASHAGGALDDAAHVLLRLEGGATANLWATQSAAGTRPGFRIRLFGSRGSLEWSLTAPDDLAIGSLTEPLAAPPALAHSAWQVSFVAAFTRLYSDAADLFEGRESLCPTLADGVRGLAFVDAALRSSATREWVDLPA